MADTAIFDVDGTLVDTNYHHALAWFRAFRQFDLTLPLWRLHRGIGMGGDLFVAHVAGQQVEQTHGDDLREAWDIEYEKLIDEVQPFEGAYDLLHAVKQRGLRLVLASSGKREQLERYVELIGAASLTDAWTTSEDAAHSKPAPDLVQNAVQKVAGHEAVMFGDSVWDVRAAGKLAIPTVAVLTGGFSAAELRDAGAVSVFDSLVALREGLDDTPLRATQRTH